MSAVVDVQDRFERALEALVEKVQEDRHILAAILMGSLSHDVVFEKSDIDLLLISQDNREESRSFALVEHDVNIHATVQTRSSFRQLVERQVGSSIMHSALAMSRLLFTRDETIAKLYENLGGLGSRDRQAQLLSAGVQAIYPLYKAEKFCNTKNDPHYAYLWIAQAYTGLAKIEVLQNNEIASREVLEQALRLNPEFFERIYTRLLDAKKTRARVQGVLEEIDAWLTEKIPLLFQPVLDYLHDAGDVRSASEIGEWFMSQHGVGMAVSACEWLADKGVITKVSTPVRLTKKSQTELEEMAFYYDRDS